MSVWCLCSFVWLLRVDDNGLVVTAASSTGRRAARSAVRWGRGSCRAAGGGLLAWAGDSDALATRPPRRHPPGNATVGRCGRRGDGREEAWPLRETRKAPWCLSLVGDGVEGVVGDGWGSLCQDEWRRGCLLCDMSAGQWGCGSGGGARLMASHGRSDDSLPPARCSRGGDGPPGWVVPFCPHASGCREPHPTTACTRLFDRLRCFVVCSARRLFRLFLVVNKMVAVGAAVTFPSAPSVPEV